MSQTREVLNFNTGWKFIDQDVEECRNDDYDDSPFADICIPHSNRTFAHHYFSEEAYRFVSWYRRPFFLGKESGSKRVRVEFDGVMTVATVFVNGVKVCEHKGGYTGFGCDITEAVRLGGQNIMAVRVDSTERKDVPPEGGNVDYMQFGGIYRNVRMTILDPLYIEDLFAIPEMTGETEARITIQVELRNLYDRERGFSLITRLSDVGGNTLSEQTSKGKIEARSGSRIAVSHLIAAPRLWHPDDPYLYSVEAAIDSQQERLDSVSRRFGVRKVEFRDDGGFYLNGQAMKLRGLDRHQVFPYLGAAMPDRVQRKDADILKYDLGLNFVRSSHYPPAPSFLDRCDEIGLLVFEEIPGWVFVGDEEWKRLAKRNLEEMIRRDRNHPSVILWGVRINESFDDHDLYVQTNSIAHQLDPTRPTGGVRYFVDSEFLEDVFTVNDFEDNLAGRLHTPVHVPSLVTEYMGHMFPTRSYDPEERIIRHAKLHASIQSCQYGIPNLAGACGWCAFDYYTTSLFGAGDHICYHGVCDVFRIPKFAAHFYRSQMDPKVGVELFIARYLTPEFNDCGDSLTVFSNCERVDLYVDGEKFDSQTPDRAKYPNLPHPPFTFTGIQASWKGKRTTKQQAIYEWNSMSWAVARWLGTMITRIEAVGIIDGKEAARQAIEMFGQASRVSVRADDGELVADGADCTRLVVKILDEKNQTLPLAHHAVSFELSGPGKIIGDNPLSVERGIGAVYVRAGLEPGTITVTARSQGLQEDTAQLRLVEMTAEKVALSQ